MNDIPATDTVSDQPPAVTQAQLYDDLRRIGELEDQKHAIQTEIEEKTERLRLALPQLDNDSLLGQMLSAALQPTSKSQNRTASGRSPKKKKETKKKAKTTNRKRSSNGGR